MPRRRTFAAGILSSAHSTPPRSAILAALVDVRDEYAGTGARRSLELPSTWRTPPGLRTRVESRADPSDSESGSMPSGPSPGPHDRIRTLESVRHDGTGTGSGLPPFVCADAAVPNRAPANGACASRVPPLFGWLPGPRGARLQACEPGWKRGSTQGDWLASHASTSRSSRSVSPSGRPAGITLVRSSCASSISSGANRRSRPVRSR